MLKMPNQKESLRKHFLKARKNIKDKDARIASIQAAEIFFQSIKTSHAKIIAIYHPIQNEIDPLPLLSKINDVTFALPIVTGKDKHLEFHPWKENEKLKKNPLYPSISEPHIHGEAIIPDIILIPMLAFDSNLHRLGYGGGFYDRTIQKIKDTSGKKPFLVGYAYEFQKSPTPLPTNAHDMNLDAIITEQTIYK